MDPHNPFAILDIDYPIISRSCLNAGSTLDLLSRYTSEHILASNLGNLLLRR